MNAIFRAIWVVGYRELLRFVQERSRLISSFGMPLIFLVVFGAGFGRMIGTVVPGVDYIQFMYPGILAMTVLMNSLMSGVSIVWDREFGFLKEILVSPLDRRGILLGKATGSAVVAIIQGSVMLILAPFLGISLTFFTVLKLIPVLFIVSIAISSLGLLVASRMKSQQGFQMVIQLLIMPLIFLAGVFYPVNNVPLIMEVISKINPLTYGVDAIRQVFLGADSAYEIGITIFGHTMSVLDDIIVVSILGLGLISAAVWSFNRSE
ncbi:MAG: ABC transporter permease [Dehalococcoidales bacterium]|jgi:ABC-2 type transport system permease protein|nr:ABC transporter permease [Dehalococcoidales bacterium]MDD3265095.1 ABC transporter permease [Dehalococcoidales bacterium]MDD4322964.1 ABC transporter permease [Dehalococcoidales bacterium]MDD4793930.1 ABC transporter permease [Dehalococcoidales bacterium]MDD5122513.1 ABC transporter permease [Dehalococcoidales bacterium]